MALILPRNWCLLFFRDPRAEFTPSRMKTILRDAGLRVTGRNEPFSVDWGGPTISVSIQRGKQIETVLRGLVGPRRQYREHITGCDAHIKIELRDVDETLDEINTLIQVQSALQDATGGLMYLSWNNQFSAAENESPRAKPQPASREKKPSAQRPATPSKKALDAAPDREWLRSAKGVVISMLRDRLTDRKMRLFACACCRQIWDHIDDPGSRSKVALAEAFADGQASDRQRGKALAEAKAATDEAIANRSGADNDRWQWLDAVSQTLEKNLTKYPALVGQNASWVLAKKFAPGGRVTGEAGEPYRDQAEALQADVVRDIFSNPSRTVVLKKRWLTSRVREIADAIYQERAYDRLPMLADALSAAGCDDKDIIEHCRGPGPHVRGCWVVDLLLEKA